MPAQANLRRDTSCVFAMHGVVEAVNPNWISHRNFLPRENFEQHLKTRTAAYVDLNSAFENKGDALTIDDATYAAYDAAKLARRYGHEVTLFVNPHNVLDSAPYFFAQLCLILDHTPAQSFSFRGEEFKLTDLEGRFALRQRVKQELQTLAAETDRRQCVQDLADALRVEPNMPRFFQTLSLESLHESSRLGVQIGNHGWTHAAISALPPAAAQDEIVKGRHWVEENFAVRADAYAVPFGKNTPHFPMASTICEHWLLNDSLRPAGFVSTGILNRKTLKLKQAA